MSVLLIQLMMLYMIRTDSCHLKVILLVFFHGTLNVILRNTLCLLHTSATVECNIEDIFNGLIITYVDTVLMIVDTLFL